MPRRCTPSILLLSLVCAAPALRAEAPVAVPTPSAAPSPIATPRAAPPPLSPTLPAEDGNAKLALETSPRHGEWVDIPLPGSDTRIRGFVVYPERKDKAPVVIVIHEVYGLSDWIRAVADRLAADGFIAVAPDMLSGLGPGGGGSDSVSSRDDVVKLVRGLSPGEVVRRLDAVRAYALALPAATSKSATLGFCWGGGRSFAYATAQPGLNAAVVFYGGSPDAPDLARLSAPVLGLYGGDDARVNATVEPAANELKRLGKTYEVETYDGAGHGFLRAQSEREGANRRATEKAWPRVLAFVRKHTGDAR